MSNHQIVLASTSPFRKAILEKLQLPFSCCKPETDETPLENESAIELVERLAQLKAQAGFSLHPNNFVIGSDQVAFSDGEILGKPGNFDNAFAQLSKLSGKAVKFYTGLALINPEGQLKSSVEVFEVHFRSLTSDEISAYLHLEQPYNCAGSFKSEALGITLFDKLLGDDPNTLIGLPLIKLCEFFRAFGFDPLIQKW